MTNSADTTLTSSTGPRALKRGKALLLTGAAGVVGQALLSRLKESEVICLVHRRPIAERPGLVSVQGDITQPKLGLSRADYGALAKHVDAVIHCAAVTDFNRKDGSLEATNAAGTEAIIQFAEAGDIPVFHVSTAYVDAHADGERGRNAARYATSKRAAEDIVRAGSVPHTILRPSVVIGDSRTGYITSFQGFYLAVRAILKGVVPLIPFDPAWPIDFVPADIVADAIATAVEHELVGELWVTAGERALSLEDTVAHCLTFGRKIGMAVDTPRFVPPEAFDRLIGPVFLALLPPKVRDNALRLLDFFSIYLSAGSSFPSSLGQLGGLGMQPMPDPSASLAVSLRYWAETTRHAPSRPAGAVA